MRKRENVPRHDAQVVYCRALGFRERRMALEQGEWVMTAENKRICPDFNAEARRFHLLGCCGTGMGALGILLCEAGYEVSGSDTGFYPPMSDILARSGIRTMVGWKPENLDGLRPEDTIVVVGNVCRRTNEECLAAMERGFTTLSQAETLYHFFLKPCARRVVVSGTHGKTTTSSLLASVLTAGGIDASVFIGGEVLAYGCGAHLGKSNTFVVEGDEYDTAWFDKVPKFWHYAPTHLCINNIEFDHADIYENLEAILDVFARLVSEMPEDGVIVYNADDANVCRIVTRARCRTVGYSLAASPQADFDARAIVYHDGGVSFDLYARGTQHTVRFDSPLTGQHNVYNLTSAAIMAQILGVSIEGVKAGFLAYRGVKKRQEWIGTVDDIAIYDDFAHHPTAVRETVRAIRKRYPAHRIWGIFEMKSNTSRRAVFQHDYPEALSECDEVILSAPWKKDDLPPEMLIDIPRVAADLNARGVHARLIPDIEAIVEVLARETRPGDIVLGMSGSAFGGLHRKLLARLEETRLGRRES